MTIDHLIQVSHFTGSGYKPLVDYQSWRVAVLRYIDELLPEQIDKVECHTETDEVFILTQGKCILFIAESDGLQIQHIHAVDMELNKLYNVRKWTYHTHTLSADAHVIIIENQDTSSQNSNSISLNQSQKQRLCALTQNIWGLNHRD